MDYILGLVSYPKYTITAECFNIHNHIVCTYIISLLCLNDKIVLGTSASHVYKNHDIIGVPQY